MEFLTEQELDQIWSSLWEEPKHTKDIFKYQSTCACFFCKSIEKAAQQQQQTNHQQQQTNQDDIIILKLEKIGKENIKP